MRAFWNQFWSTISRIFSTIDHAAGALENVAIVGEETSAAWVDQTRIERQAKAIVGKREIKELKAS